MDALLLAAGFGTRLRPLTLGLPKILLPIYGTKLLDFHLDHLLQSTIEDGAPRFERIVVNGHFLADEVRAHLLLHPSHEKIVFSFEPKILGTGGALPHAAQYLTSDPFLVQNVDAFYPPPIDEALAFHRAHRFLATIVVADSPYQRNVQIEGDHVTGFIRGRLDETAFTFTGLHLFSQEIHGLLPRGPHNILDTYRVLITQRRLGAYVWTPPVPFTDIGSPIAYLDAHRFAASSAADYGISVPAGLRLARGYGFIDDSAVVGQDVQVGESVVLANAHLEDGCTVQGSIIGPGVKVFGEVIGRLLTRQGSREVED